MLMQLSVHEFLMVAAYHYGEQKDWTLKFNKPDPSFPPDIICQVGRVGPRMLYRFSLSQRVWTTFFYCVWGPHVGHDSQVIYQSFIYWREDVAQILINYKSFSFN